MCVVCKTSGYPVVEVLTSTSARAVIPLLDRIFSEFGIPRTFGSDNGPPFQSHEFSRYLDYMGVKHQKSTPYWPRGNAKCERFMKSMGKVVRMAQVERKPWKQTLNQFLRSYRAAPHSSTGLSPNQLMFGRNISSRLPETNEARSIQAEHDLETAIGNSSKAADKNRAYGNKKLSTKISTIKPGDTVLVKQRKVNKLTSPYSTNKLTVVSRNGSWIVSKDRDGKEISRNISFFKLWLPPDNPAPQQDVPKEDEEEVQSDDDLPRMEETVNEMDNSGNLTIDYGTPVASALTSDGEGESSKTKVGSDLNKAEGVDEENKKFEVVAGTGVTPKRSWKPAARPKLSGSGSGSSKHSKKKDSETKKRVHRATRKEINYKEGRSYNKKPKPEEDGKGVEVMEGRQSTEETSGDL